MRLFPLLLLVGCWYVDDARYRDEVMDLDGDGGLSERFGGADCLDDDPTIADCDADDDGHRTTAAGGDDCDDADPAVRPVPWYADDDGDGFGAGPSPQDGCGEPPAGLSATDGDCAPADPDAHPGAPEDCGPVDRSCDGDPTGGAVDAALTVYVDRDEDGFGAAPVPVPRCAAGPYESLTDGDCDDADPATNPGAPEVPGDGVDQNCLPGDEDDADGDGVAGAAWGGTDCDDADPAIFPGAPEACNGADDDCDGLVDDDEDDADQAPGEQLPWYVDADADGWGDALVLRCPDAPLEDGLVALDGDCDDGLALVHPGADEVCDGLDQDCDQLIDEDAIDLLVAFVDQDHDGWGDAPYAACAADGLVLRDGDCDDLRPEVYPDAPEICGDAVRQDCAALPADDCDGDGARDAVDCADADPAIFPGADEICNGVDDDCNEGIDEAKDISADEVEDWYVDADRDGWGSPVLAARQCTPPAGAVANRDDCDDLRVDVHPDAPEVCDGVDQDCDASVDEDPADPTRAWRDADADGHGDPGVWRDACGAPLDGWVAAGDDCDDADPGRSPGRDELCDDGIDNDCDALVDAADPDADAASGATWSLDADGDGVGGPVTMQACGDPSWAAETWVQASGDCDDADPALTTADLWWADRDGDGVAGALSVAWSCGPPDADGWSLTPDDCDDADADVHPDLSGDPLGHVKDGCDHVDNDCDGLLDEEPDGDPDALTLYIDADDDLHGAGVGVLSCSITGGFALVADDCDDASAEAFPGNPIEACDGGLDNDCDGRTDYAENVVPAGLLRAPDADGDTYGDDAFTLAFCPTAPIPSGWVAALGDCDDDDPGVSPGATETCDGADQDCDQQIDDVTFVGLYDDLDRDGYGGAILATDCATAHATTDTDCDDDEPDINPGALDVCGDAVDEDCTDGPAECPPCIGWQFFDNDGDGWGSSIYGNSGAVYSCAPIPDHAPYPGDCNDYDAGNTPDPLYPIANAAAIEAAVAQTGCHVVYLPFGSFTVGLTLGPSVLVLGDPAGTTLSIPPSKDPVVASAEGSSFVMDVVIQGDGSGAGPLVSFTPILASAKLGLVDVDLVTAGAQAVSAQGWGAQQLWLLGTHITDAGVLADAVDLQLVSPTFKALSIVDSPGATVISTANGSMMEDVSLLRSGPLTLSGNLTQYLGVIRGLDVRDAISDGVIVAPSAGVTLTLQDVVVAGSMFSGVRNLGPGSLKLQRATVLGNDLNGVWANSGPVTIDQSIVRDNLFDLYTQNIASSITALSSTYGSTAGGGLIAGQSLVGTPSFVTWDPNLDPALWDLHLRTGAFHPGATNADTVGAYVNDASWYFDFSPADGLYDGWVADWLPPPYDPDPAADPDWDGLTNDDELFFGTRPDLLDTDGDGKDDKDDKARLDPLVQ